MEQNINLNTIPGAICPVVNVSQGDVGRKFKIRLNEDNQVYSLDGTETLTISGYKPDGNVFMYQISPTPTGSIVEIETTDQMTARNGDVLCELRIEKGTEHIGTCNFVMKVEVSPSESGPLSESALDYIEGLIQHVDDDTEEAAASATLSESWAVGGTDTRSGENTNNSKYFSQQSANSATAAHTSEVNAANSESNAATSATNSAHSASVANDRADAASTSANIANNNAMLSQSWAVGTGAARPDEETNNSKYFAEESADSATNSANSAVAAATSATNASGYANEAANASTSAAASASAANTSATNAATSETNAANSASSASTSATNAANSASSASTSATDAKNWAVGPSGSGSGTNTNNAKYYATQAATSATNAANSASTATTKASEASTSATNADNSADSAATSASTATTKANAASTSATNAANSASAASTSETNAASSASAASTSETNAASSASAASTSETNAASSASAASTSETNAKNWAVGPSGSGSGTNTNNAKYYATQASTSATNAANSATAAAASESKIANLTVSAQSVPYTQSADVVKTEVGGVYNLDFKIPRGEPTSGHDVEANPSGAATGDLTKLGIDGTIYNIASGSGSAGVLPAFLNASQVKSGATFSSVVEWLTGGSGQADSDFIWIYYYNRANANKFPFLRTESGHPTKELDVVDLDSFQVVGFWSNISEKIHAATSKMPCNILYDVYNKYSTYPKIKDIEYYGSNAILYYDSNFSAYPAIIVYGKTTSSGINDADLEGLLWHVTSVKAAKGCWKEV